MGDESFENATPVSPESLPGGPRASGSRTKDEPPQPALEDLVKKIPEEARRAAGELLRAQFTSVRRIRPDQMI